MRSRSHLTKLAVLLTVFLPPRASGDVIFDATGFDPHRQYFTLLPYEHIDPMTGNLLLTFTDLVLPGNAGFDLRIQRTYNSKIYRNFHTAGATLDEDTWAGVGWTLHLGRIPPQSAPGVPPPPIEMPDGSRHPLFRHAAPSAFLCPTNGTNCFITRDFWVYNANNFVLKLPSGVEYTFGEIITLPSGQTYRYVTRITDPFGNEITVQYMNPTLPRDGISSITHTVGGTQTHMVTFAATTDGLRRLQSMTFSGRTWNYGGIVANGGFSLLTSVSPPVGPGWSFQYFTTTPPHELKKVTSPFGGTISVGFQND